jgi:hypothetical protein
MALSGLDVVRDPIVVLRPNPGLQRRRHEPGQPRGANTNHSMRSR